ncbi:MAG TPA: serine hydrolase [Candidatus Solibacter sp.]|nr:serine hydrolase [Candidatus Solibacter sp.]
MRLKYLAPKYQALKYLAMLAASCLAAHAAAAYWPGEKWRTAQPESQGLDSQALASAVDRVLQDHLGVHSLLVIRHGYTVLDAYFYPYNSSVPHDLASVTKSITSVLTGIAAGQGLVNADRKLLSFFPNERPENPYELKQRITVGNLLHMESGLDCGYLPGEQELEQMKRSANWVKFALALPMKYEPGTHSSYCSPGYHLLGSVIASAARQSELEFGRKNLFGPLSIREVVWADDPQGRSHGWGDSHLFPQDLAKIGYLYLHGGQWDGKQIVPADWVTMATTPATAERGGPGALGIEWNASNGPNGRQYGGNGRGGQSLIVWPELDMIVVITAGGNAGQIAPLIRQAVKSEAALPAKVNAYRQLHMKAARAARAPEADAVPPLPAMAAKISGVRYDFPLNPSRLDSLSLQFGREPRLNVKYLGQELSFPLGLDGRYNLGPHGPLHLLAGAKGQWTSENEFLLDLNFIANINHYTLKLRFDGSKIEVDATEASGLIRNGHITGTAAALP